MKLRNPKILLVEDEKLIGQAYVEGLSRAGFSVIWGQDGFEGLKLAFSEHPDLILLDLLMPKMDGMTMFKKLRNDDWGKNVKVIILTNLNATDENLVADVVEYKPLKYLVKLDWNISDVAREIHKLLA